MKKSIQQLKKNPKPRSLDKLIYLMSEKSLVIKKNNERILKTTKPLNKVNSSKKDKNLNIKTAELSKDNAQIKNDDQLLKKRLLHKFIELNKDLSFMEQKLVTNGREVKKRNLVRKTKRKIHQKNF